ncbi:deoxynucleoside kinase [Xiashengella succiniciproducens]|jgi:deoxyadenosine/deoxycytidine kinase|uniref:Deoxynucleoside kinase n=1 Tax=Xiashengella succiniciproducens TaxID=2949635 RepID=A0A9J6ZPD4_9BACT|nr:deoxynucleoside kinase [Alkaliflexus sp. Ai-910]MDI9539158.1 deoxynucleoside kinase [Bacteroidota bacterium]URW79762.1 deoxynucleoside kinase [Alkaliflexus sp. Ai-910]HHU01334.1 deoxynucleoside kinase [Bacteroidales bacterium]
MHIAIAGNIGAGKTTLASLLAKQYGWRPHFEEVDDNPYLADFYDDMKRWSFNLQVYFLHSRFAQILKIKESKETVVQDRTIFEDAYIFATNLHEMGLMSDRDFNSYLSLFELMTKLIQPPDLLIYLRASVPTLFRQIEQRGRPYEAGIRLDYLSSLNEKYEKWMMNYKDGELLTINVDELDFIKDPKALSIIIDKINAKLHGLF